MWVTHTWKIMIQSCTSFVWHQVVATCTKLWHNLIIRINTDWMEFSLHFSYDPLNPRIDHREKARYITFWFGVAEEKQIADITRKYVIVKLAEHLKALAACLFVQQVVHIGNEGNTKALHYKYFVNGIHPSQRPIAGWWSPDEAIFN